MHIPASSPDVVEVPDKLLWFKSSSVFTSGMHNPKAEVVGAVPLKPKGSPNKARQISQPANHKPTAITRDAAVQPSTQSAQCGLPRLAEGQAGKTHCQGFQVTKVPHGLRQQLQAVQVAEVQLSV